MTNYPSAPISEAMILLLLSLSLCCSAQLEIRQRRRVSASEGSTALLECLVEGAESQDFPLVHWLKQIPGEAPTYILSHGIASHERRTQPRAQHFQPIRKNSRENFLQITQLVTSDSGVYWCLMTNASSYPMWGNGTILSVYGGQDILPPSVSLLSSGEHLNGASLVYVLCLVSNFYPPVIEVTWKVGGQATTEGSATGPVSSDRENSYSLMSILELSVHQGLDLSTVSCEVRHDSSWTLVSKNFSECHRNTVN
ncbi:immunoglobulin lambda-1 light chain-like [Pelodytes ibericus]